MIAGLACLAFAASASVGAGSPAASASAVPAPPEGPWAGAFAAQYERDARTHTIVAWAPARLFITWDEDPAQPRGVVFLRPEDGVRVAADGAFEFVNADGDVVGHFRNTAGSDIRWAVVDGHRPVRLGTAADKTHATAGAALETTKDPLDKNTSGFICTSYSGVNDCVSTTEEDFADKIWHYLEILTTNHLYNGWACDDYHGCNDKLYWGFGPHEFDYCWDHDYHFWISGGLPVDAYTWLEESAAGPMAVIQYNDDSMAC